MRDAAARQRAGLEDSSTAPVPSPNPPVEDEDEAPRLQFTARNLLVLGGFLVASLAALYYLLPQIAGLEDTWHRIEDGSPWWMFVALVFTGERCGTTSTSSEFISEATGTKSRISR